MIVRVSIVAFAWLRATGSVWAQALPERSTIKKPSPISRTGNNGSCGLGVISSVGDEFQVQKVSLFNLRNTETIVPISNWGLDDLAFERVRAAAGPGTIVRRIPYTKEAFPLPKEPIFTLFRDRNAELVELLRQVTNGTSCQRYVLVSKSIACFSAQT